MKNGDFPMKNGDLPMKNGDFPMKNGDLPMKNGDFPMKNCDFPMKNGDFPMKHGGSFHRFLVCLPGRVTIKKSVGDFFRGLEANGFDYETTKTCRRDVFQQRKRFENFAGYTCI